MRHAGHVLHTSMSPCIATSTPRITTIAFWLTRKPGFYRKQLHGSASQPQRFSDSKLPHSDTLTAIHRANLILPKVLPPAKSSVWMKLLRTSGDILSGAAVRGHRIAGEFLRSRPTLQVSYVHPIFTPQCLVWMIFADPIN